MLDVEKVREPSRKPSSNAKASAKKEPNGDLQHRLPAALAEMIQCPEGHPITQSERGLECAYCSLVFPMVDGVPVMLMSAASEGKLNDAYSAKSETGTESVSFYNQFYKNQTDYKRYQSGDIDFIKKIFKKLNLSAKSKVADFGAGTGYFGYVMKSVIDIEPYNCDFSIEGFRTARERYGLKNLVVSDAYQPAIKAGSLDALFAMSLTPFKKKKTEDMANLISILAKTLKPEGHFVFTWPSNLTGKIADATLTVNEGQSSKVSGYYNHTRTFIHQSFLESGEFSSVESYVFIRPLSFMYGPFTFTKLGTLLTETLMKVMPPRFSSRILVIGKKE